MNTLSRSTLMYSSVVDWSLLFTFGSPNQLLILTYASMPVLALHAGALPSMMYDSLSLPALVLMLNMALNAYLLPDGGFVWWPTSARISTRLCHESDLIPRGT